MVDVREIEMMGIMHGLQVREGPLEMTFQTPGLSSQTVKFRRNWKLS